MAKVAVVLSGCGVYDGSEIHESVLTLLYLKQGGADVVFLAPDVEQMNVINHISGEALNESRNVLVEAARIARGKIVNIKEVNAGDFDAAIFPGGFGAAKNLSDFAVKGSDCKVHIDVERFILDALKAKIGLGFICIAPAVMARVGKSIELHPQLTIGDDPETAKALEAMGAMHRACTIDSIVVDEEHKIVSTPAYMFDAQIQEVARGVELLVQKVLELSSAG
jgi:enhancing lycopene biosynthesis protein 2